MANSVPLVKFGEIFKRVERKLQVEDAETYECVGVKWHGEGTFIRETKIGLEIKKKGQFIVKEDDIVYNKLFAWKGSFAIADKTVDGCIVSDKFPTYNLSTDKIDKEYLRFYFKSATIEKQAELLSTGMAAISKFTLNPPKFFELTIPAPSLSVQKRIVEVLKDTSGKIREITRLREESKQYLEYILKKETEKITKTFPSAPISSMLTSIRRGVVLREDEIYRQVTVQMENRGVKLRCEKNGLGISTKNQSLVKGGDLVFSKIDARNGAIGFVPDYLDNAIVSSDFPTFSLKDNIDKEYLDFLIKTTAFRQKCIDKSYGTTNRKRLKPKDFLKIEIPLPSIKDQKRVVGHLQNLKDRVVSLDKIIKESESLFPELSMAFIENTFKVAKEFKRRSM